MIDDPIVIFDGVCNFCNGAVNFIIRRDSGNVYLFTPIQSGLGRSLAKEHGIDVERMDTLVLIKKGKCYIRTDAALEISKDLDGRWHLFRVFRIVPRPIRDFFYRLFARHRYALFGRSESCMVPAEEVRGKFVGV